MRARAGILIVSVLAVGCATNNPSTLATGQQGLAEIRVDAALLLAAGITRVTVEAAGESQDLVLDFDTGTYNGTLVLPAGPQILVARAFSNTTLVGQSQPTSVDVQSGVVTIRIIDLTDQGPPRYGPLVDSLSYPTTTEAGASATFTISVIAPGNDPVSYDWTSDCQDSTFSMPTAATTSWSKAAEGACTISVTVASNGHTVARSFVIAVLPAGSGPGTLDVIGTFVTRPALELVFSGLDCVVFGDRDPSCHAMISSPVTTGYHAAVFNWGTSPPGTLELSDNCGGRLGTSQREVDDLVGNWLPPVGGGLCIITGRAVNGDGLVGTISAAILARPGSPAIAHPPHISASLDVGCVLTDSVAPAECGQVRTDRPLTLSGNIDYVDGLAGSMIVADDCGGPLPQPHIPAQFTTTWRLPNTPGRICTTTVQVTNLQGFTSEVAARYQLVNP